MKIGPLLVHCCRHYPESKSDLLFETRGEMVWFRCNRQTDVTYFVALSMLEHKEEEEEEEEFIYHK